MNGLSRKLYRKKPESAQFDCSQHNRNCREGLSTAPAGKGGRYEQIGVKDLICGGTLSLTALTAPAASQFFQFSAEIFDFALLFLFFQLFFLFFQLFKFEALLC